MKISNLIVSLGVLVLLSLLPLVSAIAGDDYCVNAKISDISPSSIEIGDDFTIGIQIENCGVKISKNVSFEIVNPTEDINIKESQVINIGELTYSNSKRLLAYHMTVSENAHPGDYILKTILIYGEDNFLLKKEGEISFKVIGDEARLNIASVKPNPVLPYKGDIVELTLRIENFGKGSANSIRVYADHPFQGIKENFLGRLNPEENGPTIFTFVADKSGEFTFPVKISYKDDFGQHEITTQTSIIILKKKTNWGGIIFGIIFLGAIIWFVFHHFKTKKRKDTIIQQLLTENGNNHHESKKKTKR